jgi:hypothetical protein
MYIFVHVVRRKVMKKGLPCFFWVDLGWGWGGGEGGIESLFAIYLPLTGENNGIFLFSGGISQDFTGSEPPDTIADYSACVLIIQRLAQPYSSLQDGVF